jgi:hypothetical protein
MNRIYQGRVSKVEILSILSASTGERNKVRCRNQNPWQTPSINFQLLTINFSRPRRESFQDVVNPFLSENHA